MNTTMRIFWLLALMTFTCGSTSVDDRPARGDRDDHAEGGGYGKKRATRSSDRHFRNQCRDGGLFWGLGRMGRGLGPLISIAS